MAQRLDYHGPDPKPESPQSDETNWLAGAGVFGCFAVIFLAGVLLLIAALVHAIQHPRDYP